MAVQLTSSADCRRHYHLAIVAPPKDGFRHSVPTIVIYNRDDVDELTSKAGDVLEQLTGLLHSNLGSFFPHLVTQQVSASGSSDQPSVDRSLTTNDYLFEITVQPTDTSYPVLSFNVNSSGFANQYLMRSQLKVHVSSLEAQRRRTQQHMEQDKGKLDHYGAAATKGSKR